MKVLFALLALLGALVCLFWLVSLLVGIIGPKERIGVNFLKKRLRQLNVDPREISDDVLFEFAANALFGATWPSMPKYNATEYKNNLEWRAEWIRAWARQEKLDPDCEKLVSMMINKAMAKRQLVNDCLQSRPGPVDTPHESHIFASLTRVFGLLTVRSEAKRIIRAISELVRVLARADAVGGFDLPKEFVEKFGLNVRFFGGPYRSVTALLPLARFDFKVAVIEMTDGRRLVQVLGGPRYAGFSFCIALPNQQIVVDIQPDIDCGVTSRGQYLCTAMQGRIRRGTFVT